MSSDDTITCKNISCNFDPWDFITYITSIIKNNVSMQPIIIKKKVNVGSLFAAADTFDEFYMAITDTRINRLYVYPQDTIQFILDFCKKYALSDQNNASIRSFIRQKFNLEDYFDIVPEILQLTYFDHDIMTNIDLLFGKFIKYAVTRNIDYNMFDIIAKKYPKKFYYLVRNVVLKQMHTIIKLLNNNLSLLDHDIFSKCYTRIIHRYYERHDSIATNNEIILKMYVDHNETIGTNYLDIIDTLLDAYIYFLDGLNNSQLCHLDYNNHIKIVQDTANTIAIIQNYCNNYIAESTDSIIRKKISHRYGGTDTYYYMYTYFTCANLVDFRIEDLLTEIYSCDANDKGYILSLVQYYIHNGNNFDPTIDITFDIANKFFLDKISYIELYKRSSDCSEIIDSVIKVYPNLFTDAKDIYNGYICCKKICKFIKASKSVEKYGFDFIKLVEINPVIIAKSIYALDYYVKKILSNVTILSPHITIDPLSKSNNDYSVHSYRQQFIDTLGLNNIATITKFIVKEHARNHNVDIILAMLKIIDIVDTDNMFNNFVVTMLFALSYSSIHIIGTNFFYKHYSIDEELSYLYVGNFGADTMCSLQIKYYDVLYASDYDYIMTKYIISRYCKTVINKVGINEYMKHFFIVFSMRTYFDPAIIIYHAKKIMKYTVIDLEQLKGYIANKYIHNILSDDNNIICIN
jgi:hypothetical protein